MHIHFSSVQLTIKLIIVMDTPNSKSSPKFAKTSSQTVVASTARGVMRQKSPPPLLTKKPSLVSPKSPARDNTKPQEVRLHTQQRAVKRAMFNYSVATKIYILEQQKKQVERLQKMIEEEEIRMLRKEMIPRAQLMPLFDRPFFPQRSNRPLTVPREPSFRFASSNCSNYSEAYSFFNTMKPIK